MVIEKETIAEIARKCQSITRIADSLHLTSVAKAIEKQRGCQIFIGPIPETKQLGLGRYQGFTANCEPFAILEPKNQKKWKEVFVQHFVFYKPDKDEEVERYRVAHELAHLVLHWPLGDERSKRLRYCSLRKIGRFFLVLYTLEEEEEADAFACFLGVHRPKIKRPEIIQNNDAVKKRIEHYAEKGILISQTLGK